jgi:hypothetical protein
MPERATRRPGGDDAEREVSNGRSSGELRVVPRLKAKGQTERRATRPCVTERPGIR